MAYIRSSMKVLWSPSDECFPRACGQSLVRSVGSTNALPETWAVGDQRDEGAGLSSQRMRESLTPYNNAPRWRNEEAPGACDTEGYGPWAETLEAHSCPTKLRRKMNTS